MAVSEAYLEFIRSQLASREPLTVRRMFGGAGIYSEGVMFALVADDCLYFKVDDADRAEYEGLGLAPFGYARKDGRRITIASFFPVPADVLEDPERLGEWSDKALAAARRAGYPRSASRS